MAMQHKSEGSLGPEQRKVGEGEPSSNLESQLSSNLWTRLCAADIFFSFTHFTPQRQGVLFINMKNSDSTSFAEKYRVSEKNRMASCKFAVVTLQECLFEWILCITADFKKHFRRFIFSLFISPLFCFLFPHCLSTILPLSSVSIPSSLLFLYSWLPIILLKAQASYGRRLACGSSRVCKYRIIIKIRT